MKLVTNITWPFRKLAYRIKIFKQLWEYLFASWDIVCGIDKSLEILFIDFYENCDWKENIDWDWCEEKKQQKKDIELIYRWLKYDKPANEVEIKTLRHWYFKMNPTEWQTLNRDYLKLVNICKTEMCRVYLDIAQEKETMMMKKQEEMLKKIIELSGSLWT